MNKVLKMLPFFLLGLIISVGPADAGKYGKYKTKVTVQNITSDIILTPPIVAMSRKRIPFFKLGEEPSPELADLAEGGATDGLADIFDEYRAETIQDAAPLLPGETRTYEFDPRPRRFVSFASMLLPTNDGFVGFSTRTKKLRNGGKGYKAYDAGSEENTELCADIPGPQCNGEPFSDGLAEGYVFPHAGISGESELSEMVYDWRGPVLWVKVSTVFDQFDHDEDDDE